MAREHKAKLLIYKQRTNTGLDWKTITNDHANFKHDDNTSFLHETEY